MVLHQVKETIEISSITTDADGNAFMQKRINLKEGYVHHLMQVDLFEDAIPFIRGGATDRPNIEIVISPYPAIPTEMDFQVNTPAYTFRYPSAGDDSVLFKACGDMVENTFTDFHQFPSPQIASQSFDRFYSNHVYINVHLMGIPDTEYGNIALSFLMLLNDVRVPVLESGVGILAERHNAMCAELMSNGHMVTRATLQGNVFPMWRFGGIRPEHTISALASGSYFLPIATRDEEEMQTSAQIRSAVADARSMSAYDEAFGDRFPDWVRLHLNTGIISGPVREQWPPTKYADSGNLLMF
tara:strand:+ start:665 stop:1561 length:897 start_codon:yes stop_codon:yes gene_type:complete